MMKYIPIHSNKNIHQLNWIPIHTRLSAVWLRGEALRLAVVVIHNSKRMGEFRECNYFFCFPLLTHTNTHTHKGISTTTLLTRSFVFFFSRGIWLTILYRLTNSITTTQTQRTQLMELAFNFGFRTSIFSSPYFLFNSKFKRFLWERIETKLRHVAWICSSSTWDSIRETLLDRR